MNNLLQTFREDLHKIPETSYTEFKTKAYLLKQLKAMGYEPIEILETGLLVYLDAKADKTIAFRTDIDALPVTEETGVSFVSEHPGNMHACGHDGHMSMLLGFADHLKDKQHRLRKNILLIFQPAEESIGGAKRIVDAGTFAKYNVAQVFGIHLFPELPEGTIGSRPGPFMAMANEIDVTVTGRSAHGAMPHLGVDANIILAKLLLDFQTIQTRFVSPLQPTILTFGRIEGGSVRNAISDQAVMKGTMRSFDEATQQKMSEAMRTFARQYETLYDCTINVEVKDGYLPVINDPELYQTWHQALRDDYHIHEFADPLMIAEDFSFYQRAAAGVFYYVGTRNEELGYIHSLHHPKFNFHPRVLEHGLSTYITLLEKLGGIHE